MVKKYLLAGVLAGSMGFAGALYAGEAEIVLKDNTTGSGFSVKEEVGNTTLFRARGDGNVGIGNTSPTEKLEVTGNVKISGTGNALKFPDGTSQTTAAAAGGGSGDGHSLDSADGSKADSVFVDNSGNVGIGTTAPGAALHIDGSASKAELLLQASDNGKVDINLRQGSTDKAFIALAASAGDVISGSAVGDLTIRAQNQKILFSGDGGSGHMAINSSGNVGIGTTGPITPLHVQKDGENFIGNAFRTVHATRASGVHGAFLGYDISAGGILGSTSSDLSFWTDSSGFGERVRITAAGNVGIGTTNPQGKLDVNGTIFQRGSSLHADYVFADDYKLESIESHSEFMWKEKHLKAIPGAKADENGLEVVEVGSHRKGIVEELEKAHIYIEQLNKQNKALESRLAKVEALLNVRQ